MDQTGTELQRHEHEDNFNNQLCVSNDLVVMHNLNRAEGCDLQFENNSVVVRAVCSITFHHQFSSSQNSIMRSIVRRQSSLLLEHTEMLKENSLYSLHTKARVCLLITRVIIVLLSQ
jgi:hypothetical protein